MLPLHHDPHFTFRFADDRLIPRFHLEDVEAGRWVEVFKIDPDTHERTGLLATAAVGEGGWVDLPEPITVRAGEAFIAVPQAPASSMTLGRPRRLPLAVATCSEVVGREPDDLALINALRRRGAGAVHAAWDDPAVDWPSFALVVVRSTWDYPARRDEFLAWAGRPRRLLNPPPVLAWNTDKRYLDHLARAGLPVVPTRFLEPGDAAELPAPPFVVKPAVSCAARDTARYDAGDLARAHDHVRRLQAGGRTVMLQPYLPGVESDGEAALVFIGGAYSHSIRRRALLDRPGIPAEGMLTDLGVRAYEPTSAERSLAERVLTHVPGGPAGLLYARIDLIPGPGGGPVVLEAELTEPTLFLEFSPGGVERLADRIAALADS